MIKEITKILETEYRKNGCFTDRIEIQQKYLSVWLLSIRKEGKTKTNITFPFNLAKRMLSDEAYSTFRRLPLIDEEARLESYVGEDMFKQYGNILLKL